MLPGPRCFPPVDRQSPGWLAGVHESAQALRAADGARRGDPCDAVRFEW
jgi:hypothetical protein